MNNDGLLKVRGPISTMWEYLAKVGPKNELIPYLSGHPFLHWPHLVCNTVDYCQCQSPIYQDTHFYVIKVEFELEE